MFRIDTNGNDYETPDNFAQVYLCEINNSDCMPSSLKPYVTANPVSNSNSTYHFDNVDIQNDYLLYVTTAADDFFTDNVYINGETNVVAIYEHSEQDLRDGYQMFLNLVNIYKLKNKLN